MKRTSWLAVFSLISFITSTAHADPKYQLYLKMLKKEMRVNDEIFRGSGLGTRFLPITKGTFNQTIDHFSKKKSVRPATFKQRYFIDSSFATDANSPVIYYICGEATCDGPSDTPLVNQMAQKYHAHRVALEHRYYGYSQPFSALTNENLKYLSMDQAIEDLATFQRYLQTAPKIPGVKPLKGKWISVGGSYPGELSAFYRMSHPELVVGALASSGPVLAKANFFEYDRHVARVAGAQCLAIIQKVVADVEIRIKDPVKNAEVKKMFGASDVHNDVDFLYNLADMAATAIQYGYQENFCNGLVAGDAEGKAVEAYAKQGSDLFRAFGITALQDAFEGAMSTNPKDYLGGIGFRQWMYQSCTEFGFYQVANPDAKESSRSQQISLEYHNQACDRLFGIKVPLNDAATNAKYFNKLLDSHVNHIYFTNGANDPWSNLSLTPNSPQANVNPGLQLFLIDGASHCDDLGSRMSTALSAARNQFDALMGQWLN